MITATKHTDCFIQQIVNGLVNAIFPESYIFLGLPIFDWSNTCFNSWCLVMLQNSLIILPYDSRALWIFLLAD
jgi:hypothetical protein